MTPEQIAVKKFHMTMGADDPKGPSLVDGETAGLRIAIIAEEFNEFIEATANQDLVEIADALGDLLYVIYGAGNAYGIDLEPIFNEIHDSNMKKIGPDGKVIYREDGKVMKPAGWQKPQLAPIIEKQKEEIKNEQRERNNDAINYESLGQGVSNGPGEPASDGA